MDEAGNALVVAGESGGPGRGVTGVAGYELVVGGSGEDGTSGGKVLGHREFARLYKQRPKPEDDRRSVVVNTMLARWVEGGREGRGGEEKGREERFWGGGGRAGGEVRRAQRRAGAESEEVERRAPGHGEESRHGDGEGTGGGTKLKGSAVRGWRYADAAVCGPAGT